MGKPLLSVNVPAVGRVTTQDFVRFAFLALGVVVVWNYSDRLPVVGPTMGKAKAFIRRAVGARTAV